MTTNAGVPSSANRQRGEAVRDIRTLSSEFGESRGRSEGEEETPPEEQFIEGARNFFGLDNKKNQKDKQDDGVLSHIMRAIVNVPVYPIRFVQVLIQLGYEPNPPQKRYSILFRQHLYYYPGLFSYARAIMREEGWRALYRGVGASVVNEVVHLTAMSILAPRVSQAVKWLPLNVVENGDDVPDTEENLQTSRVVVVRHTRNFIYSVTLETLVELASHPFHVITIRAMAQHIGREDIFSSVWGSMKEIYREEGISGFYAGIVPAVLNHVCSLFIYNFLRVAFELVVMRVSSNWGKLVIQGLIEVPLLMYLPRTYSYPFDLMTNMMAVNNCRLKAGLPPNMPAFGGWRDCYRYLKSSGTLYRGSVIFFPRFVYKTPPN